MPFALDAYLARIRLPARPTLDHHGLAAMQRAHRLAIPFENLDIRLGRGISLDGDRVFAKLVSAGRGGYCFEQNRLFLDALAALGFDARPLLARVWLGAAATPDLTHELLLVTIAGEQWIADAGFGGAYAPPMPLTDGATATAPDGAAFRLYRDPRGWVLARDGHPGATDGRGPGQGWVDQYSFTLADIAPTDLAMANHWTSTAPGSRFVEHVLVGIALPTGYAGLTDRAYRRFVNGRETTAVIDDPRVYRLRLSMMFGIDLTADEVAALRLF